MQRRSTVDLTPYAGHVVLVTAPGRDVSALVDDYSMRGFFALDDAALADGSAEVFGKDGELLAQFGAGVDLDADELLDLIEDNLPL